MHRRCNHIKIHLHFLRDLVQDEKVELVHCGTQEQLVDLMTKAMKVDAFEKLRKMM